MATMPTMTTMTTMPRRQLRSRVPTATQHVLVLLAASLKDATCTVLPPWSALYRLVMYPDHHLPTATPKKRKEQVLRMAAATHTAWRSHDPTRFVWQSLRCLFVGTDGQDESLKEAVRVMCALGSMCESESQFDEAVAEGRKKLSSEDKQDDQVQSLLESVQSMCDSVLANHVRDRIVHFVHAQLLAVYGVGIFGQAFDLYDRFTRMLTRLCCWVVAKPKLCQLSPEQHLDHLRWSVVPMEYYETMTARHDWIRQVCTPFSVLFCAARAVAPELHAQLCASWRTFEGCGRDGDVLHDEKVEEQLKFRRWDVNAVQKALFSMTERTGGLILLGVWRQVLRALTHMEGAYFEEMSSELCTVLRACAQGCTRGIAQFEEKLSALCEDGESSTEVVGAAQLLFGGLLLALEVSKL